VGAVVLTGGTSKSDLKDDMRGVLRTREKKGIKAYGNCHWGGEIWERGARK